MNAILRPRGLDMLDKEIERLTAQLQNMSPVESNYAKVADNLKILCESREKKNDRVISSEAILAAAVNIAGILIVLNYEKLGIVTSKAFGLIGKGKS